MVEIALVSSRKSKLKELAKNRVQGAREALDMARNPVNFFSTVQVGVTFVGVILGALGEKNLTPAIAVLLRNIPFVGAYIQPLSFLLTVGGITYLTLIVGELVPKRIAVNNPEVIASSMARPIYFLLTLTYPVVRFFGKSTELVLRLLKIKPKNKQDASADEDTILASVDSAEDLGDQIDMVYFNNLPVNTFMTPRSQIQWFDIDTYSHKDIRSHYGTYPFSQVIFCKESLDHVIGVIHIKELLRYYLTDPRFNLRKAIQKPHVFHEDALALQVLDKFGTSPGQIAIIQDGYGKTRGMVTPDDIMRACMQNGKYGKTNSPNYPVL